MRKSYRSLVNWGKREMKLIFIDFHNSDEQLFDCFRLFHKKVAGKVTRPISSWNMMFKLIKENKAILVLGYLGPELVATTYLCYNKQTVLYATGAYDRDNFDKPISHWPLFASMVKFSEYGALRFDMGEVFTDVSSNEKESKIAFFKKGFINNVVDEAFWQLDPKP